MASLGGMHLGLKHFLSCMTRVTKRTINTSRPVCHQYRTQKVHNVTPLFLQAQNHSDRTAVFDEFGAHTYTNILNCAERLTSTIVHKLVKDLNIDQERVCFLCGNNVSHVVTQWAIWMAGGISVPLCPAHPFSEIEYFITDSGTKLLIYTEDYEEKLKPFLENSKIASIVLKRNDFVHSDMVYPLEEFVRHKAATGFRKNQHYQFLNWNKFKNKEAMIIYTSGTTGKPKGVVHTYGSLDAQMQDMIEAWEWSLSDVVLHVLPLHHIHGIVNVLMTPLYVGAMCVMLPKFDASQVWGTLTSHTVLGLPRPINVFMAVPTIYAKLIQDLNKRLNIGRQATMTKRFIKMACSTKIRLMVSGSAALPEPIMARWEEITGHKLLERYGMTEIGMALTNPYSGPRISGSVGKPFPKVKVCLAKPNVYSDTGYDIFVTGDSKKTLVKTGFEDDQGELLVSGPSLFKKYWNKPHETNEAFTKDGWFKTGDTVSYKDGVYKIQGRTSVDIIKSGGFKISALDVERHLLAHPDITDVAVLGLPDVTWGQRVAVVAVLQGAKSMSLSDMKEFCSDKMPSYQMPTVLKVVEFMPRNVMGKVNKKELLSNLFEKELKKTY